MNDPRAFRDFLDAKLTNGGASLTLDEALVLWEVESQTDEERAATVQAVREALDDMQAGDTGMPAREFLAEVRSKYTVPAKP